MFFLHIFVAYGKKKSRWKQHDKPTGNKWKSKKDNKTSDSQCLVVEKSGTNDDNVTPTSIFNPVSPFQE